MFLWVFSTTIINRINNQEILRWILNIQLQLRNLNATNRNMKMLMQAAFSEIALHLYSCSSTSFMVN